MWGLSTKIGMGPPPNPLTSKQIFGQQTIFAETFLCQTTFLHRAVFNAVQREFFEAIVLCCLSTSSIPTIISQFWPFKKTRLTYNCAHLRSTKESLTDSVKNLFLRKKFCVKIFLGENLLGEHFLSEHFFWVKFFG